jgi:hypothetical protein
MAASSFKSFRKLANQGETARHQNASSTTVRLIIQIRLFCEVRSSSPANARAATRGAFLTSRLIAMLLHAILFACPLDGLPLEPAGPSLTCANSRDQAR